MAAAGKGCRRRGFGGVAGATGMVAVWDLEDRAVAEVPAAVVREGWACAGRGLVGRRDAEAAALALAPAVTPMMGWTAVEGAGSAPLLAGRGADVWRAGVIGGLGILVGLESGRRALQLGVVGGRGILLMPAGVAGCWRTVGTSDAGQQAWMVVPSSVALWQRCGFC